MKRTLFLSLLLSVVGLPLHAVEWNSETTGNQIISEDVSISGTANVGNLTFRGDSTLTGGNIGGSGHLTVESGTVVFDGVSRGSSVGNVSVAAGATLEVKNGAQILQNTNHNSTSVVTVNGTLKVDSLQYGGSLGKLHDNVNCEGFTDALVLNGGESAATGPRVEVTESGSATIGARLNGWGVFFTFAVADGKNFSWNASGNGNVVAHNGAGSVLVLEAGEGATFTLGKHIGTGLTLSKTGTGTLVLNSTLNLDSGRRISIENGTVKFGDNAAITSAGDGFFVLEEATMDLDGKAGLSGLRATVNGAVINAENNAMTLTLGSTGSFSIAGDATSGYSGSLVLNEGAVVDLGGYVFYNSIDISSGGTLLNAENHRGSVTLGVDEYGTTAIDSSLLSTYGSSLASGGTMEVSLSETFAAEAPGFELLRGRLYAANSLSIAGTGEESVSVSGYTSEFGAVSAQGGDICITDVVDVTLSDNHATSETEEDYMRAGALSAAGNVTVEAAGDIAITGNSAAIQSESAGAVYAGTDMSLTGASITISDNSSEYSGGALKSAYGTTYLTATEGSIEICGNTAAESGGALYASSGVEITAEGDITISNNTAADADGGAIYCDDAVIFTPGEGGTVTISGNEAGGNGGAIYSYGTVSMSGGTYNVSGNTAGSYGGAVYAESVEISADAGNITFSGNTHDGGVANDVELSGGTATLSASNGYTLEMQGGVTCAAEINISTDADSTVKLGGTSSTETLTIENANLQGLTDADGNQAVIYVSSAVTLDNACLQDITLVDEYGEASLTSSASTYAYNDATAMLFEELDGAEVCCTSSAPLLNGFASVSGDLTIDLGYDFLQAALEASGGVADIALTLMADTLAIEGEDGFTFSLSENTLAILDASVLESYGLYNEEGTLLDVNTLTLYDAGTVILRINDLSYVIPEPATATLSLLALSALSLRRRRR